MCGCLTHMPMLCNKVNKCFTDSQPRISGALLAGRSAATDAAAGDTPLARPFTCALDPSPADKGATRWLSVMGKRADAAATYRFRATGAWYGWGLQAGPAPHPG
jgi:hypothetical protein